MLKAMLVEGVQVDMVYGDESGELPPFNECGRFAGKEEHEEMCVIFNKAIEEFMQKNTETINKKDLNLWICFVHTIDPKEHERLASQVYQTEAMCFRGDWKYLFGRGYAIYGADWSGSFNVKEADKKLCLAEETVDSSPKAVSGVSIYGLFWFNNDFTEIELDEKIVFDDEDLSPNIIKSPKKGHVHYDKEFLYRKRGRVVLECGQIIIYTGKNCPVYDPAEYSDESPRIGTNLVIKAFNLAGYKYRVRIRQDSHWNGDGY
jgi:hypothetical protein